MKSIARRMLAVFGAGLMCALLSACDHFAADPIAFTRVGDSVVARVCMPVTISSIELKTYVDDDDFTGTPVWTARGKADVEEGAEFALGETLAGLRLRSGSASTADVLAQLGDRFAIAITARDEFGRHEFFASIDAVDLDASRWIDGYGAVDTPCVRTECPPRYACLNEWPQPSGRAVEPDPTWTPMTAPWSR